MPTADPARRLHWSVYVEMYLSAFSFFYAVGAMFDGKYEWAAVFVGLSAFAALAAWDIDRRRRNAR